MALTSPPSSRGADLKASQRWRISPVGALAHPGVAGLITLIAFAASSNFRWGVPWVWHFVAAAVFYGALIWIGRAATSAALQRDEQWMRRAPFDVEIDTREGSGPVVVELSFPPGKAPPVPVLQQALARAGLKKRFLLLHRDFRVVTLMHRGWRPSLRRDARMLLGRVAMPWSKIHGLDHARFRARKAQSSLRQ